MQRVLRIELALRLYQRGMLAVGPGRCLVGISKREFIEELVWRKIERYYTMEE